MTDLMSVESAAQAAYIVATLLFILALAGLSHHESARLGNTFGMAGMTVALVATIVLAIDRDVSGIGLTLLVVAMLVGWNGYLHVEGDPEGAEAAALAVQDLTGIHSAEVGIGVFIGAVTFTG